MENLLFKHQLAENLLQIKAIQINLQNPYTWASGWKSPVYCDNRKLLSYPEIRNNVKNGLIEMIQTYFPDVNCIAGVATAGIPYASFIADNLQLPLIYVRSKAKEHGTGQTVEGEIKHGMRVVVVEDTISTGKSSLKAVQDLRAAGCEVIGMVAVYKYGFESTKKQFEEDAVILKTLTNYEILIKVASEKEYIDNSNLEMLHLWRQNPADWKGI